VQGEALSVIMFIIGFGCKRHAHARLRTPPLNSGVRQHDGIPNGNRMIELSPGHKAHFTAKWARTMTKWLITKSSRAKVRWRFVEFGGVTGSESYGIVDIIAVRKNHKTNKPGLKRGDLLDIILIQVKGGSAPRPIESDLDRLISVAKHHRARAVVLAEWKKGKRLNLHVLSGREWVECDPVDVFR